MARSTERVHRKKGRCVVHHFDDISTSTRIYDEAGARSGLRGAAIGRGQAFSRLPKKKKRKKEKKIKISGIGSPALGGPMSTLCHPLIQYPSSDPQLNDMAILIRRNYGQSVWKLSHNGGRLNVAQPSGIRCQPPALLG
jgi:hypothetical protein